VVQHVTVPNYQLLKTGTLLGGALKPVAAHHRLSVDELLGMLDLGSSGHPPHPFAAFAPRWFTLFLFPEN